MQFWTLYREKETEHLGDLVHRQQSAQSEPDGGDTPEMVDVDGDSDTEQQPQGPDAVNASVEAQTMEIQRIWRLQLKGAFNSYFEFLFDSQRISISLIVPHSEIEETYRKYQDWEATIFGAAGSEMKGVYTKTKKTSRRRMEWEQKLSALPMPQSPGMASSERLELWKRYIGVVDENGKCRPNTVWIY